MKRALPILLVIVGTLVGCQPTQGLYARRLQDAHNQLTSGSPAKAADDLADAEAIATDEMVQPTCGATILQAEVKLAQGEFAQTNALAEEVLADPSVGPNDRARAREILGKASLRQGRFGDASMSFASAELGYTAAGDLERIADLIRLSHGFIAYSESDVKAARRCWQGITNERMRRSIGQLLEGTATASNQ